MESIIKRIQSLFMVFSKSTSDLKPKVTDRISKELLKKYVGENPIIIDCGAHDGRDSIELVKLLGGEIHSFEALPFVFEKLKKHTHDYASIKCYQLALGSVIGKVPFYVSSGESIGSSSILPPKDHLIDHPNTKFEEIIYVDSVTLDYWAEQNNVNKIDFMWLDMQGSEKIMLEAAPNILKTVTAIYSEVCVKETYKGMTIYEDFKKWMFEKGFSVEIEFIPKGWDCGNVLFVKKI